MFLVLLLFLFDVVSSTSWDSTSSASPEKGPNRLNSKLNFPSHLSGLKSHPDFAFLADRFEEEETLDERFEAVKFTLQSLDNEALSASTLGEELKIALLKEILALFDFDFRAVSSLITWDPDLSRKLVELRGHDLLLQAGLVDEAVQLRIALCVTFQQKIQFSNPRDVKLMEFLRRSPDKFFMVFDEINISTLPVLLFSNPKDELIIEYMHLNNRDANLPLRIAHFYHLLFSVCCSWPDLGVAVVDEASGAVANFSHPLFLMLIEILRFVPVHLEWSQELILAFELRGLVKSRDDVVPAYRASLLEAAFLGRRYEVVTELLLNLPETKVTKLIRRDEAFKEHLIKTFKEHLITNSDGYSRLITDRNVFTCQSRSLFAAFFGFPSFLETLQKIQTEEHVKSLIRFVAPNGSLEEISVFYPRLLCFGEKWNFFVRFLEENEQADFIESLKFLLRNCKWFGFHWGKYVAQVSSQKYELICDDAELSEQLTKAPFGVLIEHE